MSYAILIGAGAVNLRDEIRLGNLKRGAGEALEEGGVGFRRGMARAMGRVTT